MANETQDQLPPPSASVIWNGDVVVMESEAVRWPAVRYIA